MATATYPIPQIPQPASAPARWPEKWRAYAALGFGIVCTAWSAILVKWADVPATTSAFYRAFFAAALLAPIWLARHHFGPAHRNRIPSRFGKPVIARRTVLLAALGGLFFAADLALYNSAILLTSAANATLLGNNAPLVVALAAWLLFGRRPSAWYWAGLFVAVLGTVVIVGKDLLASPTLQSGDLLAMIAAACFAAYLLTVEHIRSSADTLALVAISVTASAIALFVLALVNGAPLAGFSAHTWGILIILGVVAQVGGYLAITYALGHLPATVTSVCLLVQAPLTAALAVPLLGESLSFAQIAGGSLVLAGIYLVNQQRSQ